jgi:hypothetical protein
MAYMKPTRTPQKATPRQGLTPSCIAQVVEVLEGIRDDARKAYDNDIYLMMNISMVINEFKHRTKPEDK